jgi:hypothetical protein
LAVWTHQAAKVGLAKAHHAVYHILPPLSKHILDPGVRFLHLKALLTPLVAVATGDSFEQLGVCRGLFQIDPNFDVAFDETLPRRLLSTCTELAG